MKNIQCEIIHVGGDNPSAGALAQSGPSAHSMLRPGYYLVMSRHRTHLNQRGGRVVRLFGPFPTRHAAQFLSTSAAALGLVPAPAAAQQVWTREPALPRALVATPRPISVYRTAPSYWRAANARPYRPEPGSPLAVVYAA